MSIGLSLDCSFQKIFTIQITVGVSQKNPKRYGVASDNKILGWRGSQVP